MAAAALLLVMMTSGANALDCSTVRFTPLAPSAGTVIKADEGGNGSALVTFKWSVYPNVPGCSIIMQAKTKLVEEDTTKPVCATTKTTFNTTAIFSCTAAIPASSIEWEVYSDETGSRSSLVSLCIRGGLTAPTLSSPGTSTGYPAFSWSAPSTWGTVCSAKATGYHVYVSQNSNMMPKQLLGTTDSTTLLFQSDSTKLSAGTYYAQVEAFVGDTDAAPVLFKVSPTVSFTVCDPSGSLPTAPALASSAHFTTAMPTLTWTAPVSWGDECSFPVSSRQYLVYVDQDIAVTDLVATVPATQTTYPFTTPLVNGLFRWRVVARSASLQESTSDTQVFDILASSAPPAATALSPAIGGRVVAPASVGTTSVDLQWQGADWGTHTSSSAALNYYVQVQGGAWVDVGQSQTYASASFTYAGESSASWSVRSSNTESNTTTTFSFNWCTVVVPSPPTTLTPAAASTVLAGLVNFTWSTDGSLGETCSSDSLDYPIVVTASTSSRVVYGYATSTATFVGLTLAAGSYQWTVSYRGSLVATSAATAFTVCSGSAPKIPVISAPSDLASLTSSIIIVSYSIPAASTDSCASTTTVSLSYGKGGNLTYTKSCDSLTTCNFTVTGSTGSTWVYQVAATNSYGTSKSLIRTLFSGSSCVTDQALHQIPTLVPTTSGLLDLASPTVYWEPIIIDAACAQLTTATRNYDVKLSTSGASDVINSVLAQSYTFSGLAVNRKYTWTVRQSNQNYATSESFTTCDSTVTPVLTVSTPSAAGVTLNNPVTLKWSVSWGYLCTAGTIDVIVDNRPLATLSSTAKSYTLDALAAGMHTILIRAVTSKKITTVSRSVMICAPTAPATPLISSPDDGATVQTSDSLSWAASATFGTCGKATPTYHVYMGSSSSDMVIIGNTTAAPYSLSNRLTSGVFYWSVAATNGARTSEKATAHSFYLCISKAPEAFQLVSPASNSGSPSTVTFSWSATGFGDNCPTKGAAHTQVGGYTLTVMQGSTQYTSKNLTAHQTSITIPSFATGAYTWYVTKSTVVGSVTSTIRSFTVCAVTAPTAPTAISPAAGSYGAGSVTFQWRSPTNWGDSCSSSMGLTHTYLLYGASKDSYDTQSSLSLLGTTTTATSVAIPAAVFAAKGDFVWTVVAYNGIYYSTVATAMNQFVGCVPSTPVAPTLISPVDATSNHPRNVEFVVTPVMLWGETCNQDNWGTYLLYVGLMPFTKNVHTVVSSRSVEYDDNGYAIISANVTINTWQWSVATNNSFGLVSNTSSYRLLGVCEDLAPDQINFNSPAANSEVSTYAFTLTWTEPTSASYGSVCHETVPKSLTSLLMGYSNTSLTSIADVSFASSYTVSSSLPLNRSMTLYFALQTANSLMSTLSRILTVKTIATDCRDLPCVLNQGQCDKSLIQCVCFSGFGGDLCQNSLDKSKTGAIVGGVVGGGLLLLVIVTVVVLIILFKVYKGHRRLVLPPPNFTDLRWVTTKMPSFPPDSNVKLDYELLESAFLGPEGHIVIWSMLRNTAVTEIDTVSKALVYTYQRHNRSLDLLFFLIQQEVSESEDEGTLFRANSPATRAFKFYSKMIGLEYLFQTTAVLLQSVLRDIEDAQEEEKKRAETNGEELSSVKLYSSAVEVDPDKLDTSCDENINILSLQLLCQKFLLQIVRSDKQCPGDFKRLCAFLRKTIGAKFPKSVYKAIGAFMFLRFYNTAITVPESYGLMPSAPSPEARRQLVLLSKVLINLANGVQFGSKEQFMIKLNPFLNQNRVQYEKFLDKLSQDESAPLMEVPPVSDDIYHSCLGILFNQLLIIQRNDASKVEELGLSGPLISAVRAAAPKNDSSAALLNK